jgi:hypothetical protein
MSKVYLFDEFLLIAIFRDDIDREEGEGGVGRILHGGDLANYRTKLNDFTE